MDTLPSDPYLALLFRVTSLPVELQILILYWIPELEWLGILLHRFPQWRPLVTRLHAQKGIPSGISTETNPRYTRYSRGRVQWPYHLVPSRRGVQDRWTCGRVFLPLKLHQTFPLLRDVRGPLFVDTEGTWRLVREKFPDLLAGGEIEVRVRNLDPGNLFSLILRECLSLPTLRYLRITYSPGESSRRTRGILWESSESRLVLDTDYVPEMYEEIFTKLSPETLSLSSKNFSEIHRIPSNVRSLTILTEKEGDLLSLLRGLNARIRASLLEELYLTNSETDLLCSRSPGSKGLVSLKGSEYSSPVFQRLPHLRTLGFYIPYTFLEKWVTTLKLPGGRPVSLYVKLDTPVYLLEPIESQTTYLDKTGKFYRPVPIGTKDLLSTLKRRYPGILFHLVGIEE